jgi:hydrogenase maturation protease
VSSAAGTGTGAGILVVGYGNPLRGDDGVGWHVARAVAADPRVAGARVLAVHQLLPELAQDLSEARLAVLVDARLGEPPGSISVTRIAPSTGARGAWTHHLTPAALAGLARDVYGAAAEITVVAIGIGTTEPGDGLSGPVADAVPRAHEVVADLVLAHA